MKNYREILEAEETEELKFSVILKGGSIGSKSVRSARDLKGIKVIDDKIFNDIKDAKEKAKRMNKMLSPGEKKYYGLKYLVARVLDGKYTGK